MTQVRDERSPRSELSSKDSPSHLAYLSKSSAFRQSVVEKLDYGSVPSIKSSSSEATMTWEEEYAQTRILLFRSLEITGYQFISIFFILYQVVWNHRYIMYCHHAHHGAKSASDLGVHHGPLFLLTCEYTKAYARTFPLISLSIAMSMTSDMLLIQRIYYELLRHGALLQFESIDIHHDALFHIMIVCLLHMIAHVVLDLSTPGGMFIMYFTEEARQLSLLGQLKEVFMYLIVPTAAFILCVYKSYDAPSFLVPLSKYILRSSHEDPEKALHRLSNLVLIEERRVAAIVQSGELDSLQGDCESSNWSAQHVYAEIICRARTSQKESAIDKVESVGESRRLLVRLFSRSWPAKLLRHPVLADERSREFKCVLRLFGTLFLATTILSIVISVFVLQKEVHDIMAGDWEDTASLAVEMAFSLLNACLAFRALRAVVS